MSYSDTEAVGHPVAGFGLGSLEAQPAAVALYLKEGNWKLVDEYTEVKRVTEFRNARAHARASL
jgi:hypothetical protein